MPDPELGAARNGVNGHHSELRHLDLAFDCHRADESALQLVSHIQPKWRDAPGEIEIVKFTEGITNTLLKVAKKIPGHSREEIDRDSVLLRAYGNNTEILIDRDREARSHALCAERGLAPPLLARFNNGLLYRYIAGQACTSHDLIKEPVWRAVARRLGEWHARLPVAAVSTGYTNGTNCHTNGAVSALSLRRPTPNCWSVMQKWVNALPTDTPKQKARKELLQHELDRSFADLDNKRGPGDDGFVFGHCDLLCANVIMLPPTENPTTIAFIDYEYATPCPAAFDIANHFAEWGGYDCDYNMLPTRSIRHAFLQDYLTSYRSHCSESTSEDMLAFLEAEIDRYRGMPGLYWGIWALIQAQISQIDFDYASYAEVRLGEYFAWRAEDNGSRAKEGREMPLRERRWAEE